MVSKMEKDTVIILYKKGLSIRKIAADTLLTRNTVKKYIRDRIDECDLVRGGRAVLRVLPFGKRGNHHARRAEAIRKFCFQSLFLFAVHFGGSALWRAFSRNRQAPKGRTPAEGLLL